MQKILDALPATMPMGIVDGEAGEAGEAGGEAGEESGTAPPGGEPPYDGMPAGVEGAQSGPFHVPRFGSGVLIHGETPTINLALLDGQVKRTEKDYVKRFVEYVAGLCEIPTGKIYAVNEFILWKAEMEKVRHMRGYEPMHYTNPWEFMQTYCGASQGFPMLSAMTTTWVDFESTRMGENAVLRHRVLWKVWADLTAVCCAQIGVATSRKLVTHTILQIQSRQNIQRRARALAVLAKYKAEAY